MKTNNPIDMNKENEKDVSYFMLKLHILRFYIDACIDGELMLFTPHVVSGQTITITDKSGFVENMPFEEYFHCCKLFYQKENQ